MELLLSTSNLMGCLVHFAKGGHREVGVAGQSRSKSVTDGRHESNGAAVISTAPKRPDAQPSLRSTDGTLPRTKNTAVRRDEAQPVVQPREDRGSDGGGCAVVDAPSRNEQLVDVSVATGQSTAPPRDTNNHQPPPHDGQLRSTTMSLTTSRSISSRMPKEATFEAFNFADSLLRGVYAYGFERPSQVQQEILIGMTNRHVRQEFPDGIAQGPSASGKSAGIAMALLHVIASSLHSIQPPTMTKKPTSGPRTSLSSFAAPPMAAVLCATRESAIYIAELMKSLGEYLHDDMQTLWRGKRRSVSMALVGGTSVSADLRTLATEQPLVVVASPGRILDMLKRGAVRSEALEMLVLDDAEAIMRQETLYEVFAFMPKTISVTLVSTVFTPLDYGWSKKFMRRTWIAAATAPRSASMGGPARLGDVPVLPDEIRHFYVAVDDPSVKMGVLEDLYESMSISQSIVFANTRRCVDWIAETLNKGSLPCSYFHSDMMFGDRGKVLQAFQRGQTRYLVAVASAARSLVNIPWVNIVLNFDCPATASDYVQTASRLCRNSLWRPAQKGIVISLVCEADVPHLRLCEADLGIAISELPMNFLAELSDR